MTNLQTMTGAEFVAKIRKDIEVTQRDIRLAVLTVSKECVDMSRSLSETGYVGANNLILTANHLSALQSQLAAQEKVLATCLDAPAPPATSVCTCKDCEREFANER